ncbi:Pyruvate kinase [Clostridium acetobutylicum EA 2018]|uniref:pyruvate kinase n=1 Tax=Clostridium acetobutylicum TaxID=1488 RepID=UPI000200A68E|nr:pyruvate kinase [Clostridium acetobutylicum]ADZ20087.1 Pyruvate kinase [Clostridium acetobutylicum EA 2018]
MQKTKMIFTIGPSSDSEEKLKELMNAGMNAARLNFSHGTHEDHKEKIDIIKKLRKELNKNVAIVVDIKGPKIRTHNFENDKAEIKKGQTFTVMCGSEILGNSEKCSVSYDDLYKDVKKGGLLLVDDGLLEFEITDVQDKNIICKAKNNGIISNHKGVNVPGVSIGLPAVTEKDVLDLKFACKMQADLVAASFIRKAEDVSVVRKVLKENGGEDIRVISKIETQEGVDNIDKILELSDGIMVARGDMGVEIPIEDVPSIQKMIIRKCNDAGKIVITATQMLDSMIRNPRPTRAEASDVANVIYDGTDAIMLSGESASGLYPIEAAETMAKIAQKTESQIDYTKALNERKGEIITKISDAISLAACSTAAELKAAAIITATQSGITARMVSKFRPTCPIIAVTPHDDVARRLALNFGITPITSEKVVSTDELISVSIKRALNENLIKKGDLVVVVAGVPVGESGTTNMLKIQYT